MINSRNVNNIWDRCLANERIHTESFTFCSRAIFECCYKLKFITVIIRMCCIRLCAYFYIYTRYVNKNILSRNLIEWLAIKRFEIYKNDIYDDILYANHYLNTI